MSNLTPFNAKLGSTIAIVADTVALNAAINPRSKQVMITNLGSQLVFVRPNFSTAVVAATVVDIPVLANTQVIITKQEGGPDDGHVSLSIVAPAGTGSTVYVTSGEGW